MNISYTIRKLRMRCTVKIHRIPFVLIMLKSYAKYRQWDIRLILTSKD